MTLHGTPRRTCGQIGTARFEEEVYQILGRYRNGEFDATSGVVAGQLDIALTAVLDAVKESAVRIFVEKNSYAKA